MTHYELLLANRPGVDRLDRSRFAEHFGSRANYRLDDSTAHYRSEDTGVEFSFHWAPDLSDPQFATLARLQLPFARPSYFGFEAADEVEALVTRFELEVSDPHPQGIGRGAFAIETMLRGWAVANRAFVRSLAPGDQPCHQLPAGQLADLWRWNYGRHAYQEQLGDRILVPRLELIALGGGVGTAVRWSDGISTLLPRADLVLIEREFFAPRRLLGGRKPDLAVLPWDELEPQLRVFRLEREPWPHRVLQYERPSDELEAFLRQLPTADSAPEPIAAADVIDQELITDACPATALQQP